MKKSTLMTPYFFKNTSQIIKQNLLFCFLIFPFLVFTQTISFGSSGLIGENIINPTSLEFGPDDRLYVSQQDGIIWAYTISRDNASFGNGTYTITNTEEITAIKNGIVNHNDIGEINPNQQRLITGILTAGTPTNPILYVTSSDYLLGGGGGGTDTNLDTNSSIFSKLEWNGASWDRIDLVRGLARCEENHAINGLDMFESGGSTYVLISQGGNTNKGAPSNNFAGTPEYFLSASILIVNLTQLEGMTVYTDPRTNTDYIYDLPTLNDPTRIDIDNTHPEFPYPSGHPMYNASIDLGDPFGGNNSLNQAFPELGGPVQIFAPGFRNPYDIVITENGRIYTSDNGPNSLWGGFPKIYDSATDTYLGDESTITYDPLNHYITNEINESGSDISPDSFQFIGSISDANGTYYGGHPIPILAFPSRAKVITYENSGGVWTATNTYDLINLLPGTSGYFNSSFTIADFPDNPELGEYLIDEPVGSPKINILDVIHSSTNGIVEYTASNFGGIMQGNILTASFNGNINRYVLNAAGDAVLDKDVTFSGFGSIPLDVTTQGDTDIFPGTVWAATYGSNAITVFEPTDLDCVQPGEPGYDANADNDGDGYTNQDEIDNDTNICSQGSKPDDNDGDFISDLNDTDDDNDSILDVNDAFAIDPDNGTTTNLPIDYPLWNNDPGTGMFGLGFTGLMLDPSGATDYLTQFDKPNLSFGGAAGKATVDEVDGGDALTSFNSQNNGFQFGINVDSNSNPFTIHANVESPFFGIDGSQTDPVDFQSYGISIGNGDQDNYLKIVIMNGISNVDSVNGIQVLLEDGGVVTNDNSYNVPNILNASAVDLYISVDPTANTAQPFYSVDDGYSLNLLGSPITLPANFLDNTDNKGMAVGMISTARSDTTTNSFTATWDFINVSENQNGILSITTSDLNFGLTPIDNTRRSKYITLKNQGGPTDDTVTVTSFSFSGTDTSSFSSPVSFPFDINPGMSVLVPIDFISDSIIGNKTALMEVIHSGNNSSLPLILSGEITDIFAPIIRINSGGGLVTSTDGGPDWEDNSANGTTTGTSYTVSAGSSFVIDQNDMDYDDRDASIPDYIDESTYYAIMPSERSISPTSNPMIYTMSLPNGEYIVNFYAANLYNGTSEPNERVFSVNINGERVINDLDLSGRFGHRIAGMIQNNITVTDTQLDIEFIGNIESPKVNAIEILGLLFPIIEVDPIADQENCEAEIADFAVVASGGNPADNLTYAISGQPDGVGIEPTNGLVFGVISGSATTGGPNSDGIHEVTVTVSKPGSQNVSVDFLWTVNEDNIAPSITCPDEITEMVEPLITEANISIIEPTAIDNCSVTITYNGVRSDALPLTDPYSLGDTTITWTATDASGNTSSPCNQTVSVVEIMYYTLDLSVSLQGRTDYTGNYTVEIYDINDLITPVYSETNTADALGNITLNNTIAEGTYKVLVKHPIYLKRLANVNLTSNQTATLTELLAGDVNNDNVINIFDLGIFAGTYNLSDSDVGYDDRADFDDNQTVNIFDLAIFASNYSLFGETQND